MSTVHDLLGQVLSKLEIQKKPSTTKGLLRLTAEPTSSQHSSISSRQSRRLIKVSEIVKQKLTIGVNLLRVGGMGNHVFRRVFNLKEGEKLLKASQCYLSTTVGPISGFLFITTDKIAFCSDRSIIETPSPTTGEIHFRCRYKVSVPLRNIKTANKSENMKRTSQKYLQLITTDEFEFWFMGFLNYKRMFKCLHQAISQAI